MTTSTVHEGTQEERKTRLQALRRINYYLSGPPIEDREERLDILDEMLGYAVFTDTQLGRWLGFSSGFVRDRRGDRPRVFRWGQQALRQDQFAFAIDLLEAGMREERPKPLIWRAHENAGMSFDAIAGALGIRKGSVKRIVDALNGAAS